MKTKSKSLKNRIIALTTAAAVTIGAAVGVSLNKPEKVYAKVTLRGIESLVDEHSADGNSDTRDPFVILEVVPELNDARLGYLLGGEEPVKDGKSIKDMPSEAERKKAFADLENPATAMGRLFDDSSADQDIIIKELKGKAFNYEAYKEAPVDPDKTVRNSELRGKFIGARNSSGDPIGLYDENDGSTVYKKRYGDSTKNDALGAGKADPFDDLDESTNPGIYDAINSDAKPIYRRTEVYQKIDDYTKGSYILELTKVTDYSSTYPVRTTQDDSKYDYIYNWQYFKATQVNDTDELKEGDIIYQGDGGAVIGSVGTVRRFSDGAGNERLGILTYNGEIIEFSDIEALNIIANPIGPGSMPVGLSATGSDTTPTPTPTPTPAVDPLETPTSTATPTPTPTQEPGETPTPTPTQAPGDTPTPTPEITPTPTPTEDPLAKLNNITPGYDINVPKIKRFKDNNDNRAVLGAIRYDDDPSFPYLYVVTETNVAENGVYAISDVSSVPSGMEKYAPYGKRVGYTQVDGSTYNDSNASKALGPYYIKEGDADDYMYVYDDTTSPITYGPFNFRADYSMSVYQKAEYTGGFTNEEWFKQYVFDRTLGTQCENLLIDVIPVTIDKLKDYVDDADLIYFAGGRYISSDAGATTNDLDKATAMKILSKVASEDFPIMMERSTYYANLYDDSYANQKDKDERVNLTILALELMQGTLKDVTSAEWDTIATAFTDTVNGELSVPNITNPSSFDYDTLTDEQKAKLDTRLGLINSLYYSVKSTDENSKTISYFARKSVSDASYVNGTVFINDDWDDSFDNGAGIWPGKIVKTGRIVAANFYTEYSEAKISAQNGFAEILDEYEAERPIITTYGNWEDFNHTVSKATCIRYILNANNSRNMVKSHLNILDIEPYQSNQYTDEELLHNVYMNANYGKLWTCRSFESRDIITRDWILKNLMNIDPTENTMTDENGQTIPKFTVDIKQMGTKELVGRNDDLNATYDMIYIGMDTAIMNTDNDPWIGVEIKRTKTLYNEKTLNGLVYTHVGDKFGDDYSSGNDITIDKLRELKDYIKAGYAVLLSDDFFTYDAKGNLTGINTTTVDSSSNMYKLIDFIYNGDEQGNTYLGKNVVRRGSLEVKEGGATASTIKSARENFGRYLNMAKLTIEVISRPTSYNSERDKSTGDVTNMNYLVANSDGSYSLDYEVRLINNSEVDSDNTSYDCKLYLDLDADGKFEEGESLTGLVINDGSEGQSDGVFHLHAGNVYKISRLVPDEYVGFLSWKLVFVQNERKTSGSTDETSSIRSAVSGFSAVPNTGTKPVIDVLQITPNKDKNGKDVNYLNLKQDTRINELYRQVNDFSINVDLLNVSDYINKVSDDNNKYKFESSEQSYFDYLCQYDMVVVGFTDAYWFNDAANIAGAVKEKDSILAIREYTLSGRSILFTHDLTNRAMESADDGGRYATHYLRDVMGLDRYGILKEDYGIDSIAYASDSRNVIPQYNSVYDHGLLKGKVTADKRARTDAIILYNAYYADKKNRDNDSVYGYNSREDSVNYKITAYTASKGGGQTETVTAINEGQITQYPFLITEGVSGDSPTSQFEVSMTHAQSYQLNLDTDSTDENTNDDVVVWYAISNSDDGTAPSHQAGNNEKPIHGFYKALHNDVRNNYYIYSKGNVTYTGSGHSPVTGDEEKKLFVNTLVASYNSGLHAPKVVYKENPWDTSANIKGIYLPYDLNTGTETSDDGTVSYNSGWLDDTVTVNFKTLNNNFRDSLANLNVKYYVEDEGGRTSYNGKHYKEIVPKKFYLVSDIGGIGNKLTKSPVDSNVLANYKIYQAEFNTSDLQSEEQALIKDARKIYIQIGTEELSTGEITTLKATESFNPLDVYTARLFDLE